MSWEASAGRSLERARKSINFGINVDCSVCSVIRGDETHVIHGRISYTSGGVWTYQSAQAGGHIDTYPYIITHRMCDIEEHDILECAKGKFQVKNVENVYLKGGVICKQAKLVTVS